MRVGVRVRVRVRVRVGVEVRVRVRGFVGRGGAGHDHGISGLVERGGDEGAW